MANFTITATTLTFPDGTTMTTAAQSIPSGTVTNFFQAAAPTGWTKLTTNDNAAIRIVSGTGGGTGGSVGFTTAFASQTPAGTTDATTLSAPQIPSHSHSVYGASNPSSPAGGLGGAYAIAGDKVGPSYPNTYSYYATMPNSGQAGLQSTGGGGSHTHTFSSSAINLAVKYLDCIMCSKN